MNHPIKINSRGKTFRERTVIPGLRELFKLIESQPIKPRTIFMSESEWDDIKKWSNTT